MVDCPQFWLVMICGIIVVAAFQLPSMTQGGALFTLILFLIVYSPVSLIVGYCSSFLFDNYETAQGILGIAFMYVSKWEMGEGGGHILPIFLTFYQIFYRFTLNFVSTSLQVLKVWNIVYKNLRTSDLSECSRAVFKTTEFSNSDWCMQSQAWEFSHLSDFRLLVAQTYSILLIFCSFLGIFVHFRLFL